MWAAGTRTDLSIACDGSTALDDFGLIGMHCCGIGCVAKGGSVVGSPC